MSVALDAGLGAAEGELRRLAELRLQRGEVAPARQFAPGVVDDAEIHAEMRRDSRIVSSTSAATGAPTARCT